MVAVDGRPDTLPVAPRGCCWVALRDYADAVGRPYSTLHEHAAAGLLDGSSDSRPRAARRGQFWYVAAPLVQPERRRTPTPDLPEPAALSVDTEALGRDLGAAFAGVLGRHLRGAA